MSVDRGPAVLSSPQSWNRYIYAGNDPINANDPTGNVSGPYGCFGSLDELIAATSDASIGCPAAYLEPLPLVLIPIPNPQQAAIGEVSRLFYSQGLPATVGLPDGAFSPFSLNFTDAQTAELAAGLCVAQPELCVLGLVITIYVLAPEIQELITAIQSQITSRDAAPVYYPPYNAGRDSNGKCKPPDPSKYVKWQGTGGDHWHWIEWNQNPQDCMTYGKYRSGANDPGPQWHEIPAK